MAAKKIHYVEQGTIEAGERPGIIGPFLNADDAAYVAAHRPGSYGARSSVMTGTLYETLADYDPRLANQRQAEVRSEADRLERERVRAADQQRHQDIRDSARSKLTDEEWAVLNADAKPSR